MSTPRTEGIMAFVRRLGITGGEKYFALRDAVENGIEQLERDLSAAVRERDEARAECERLREFIRVNGIPMQEIESQLIKEAGEPVNVLSVMGAARRAG